MGRYLKSGAGWRVGWNPDAPQFKGLVGDENWAIELTEIEFRELRRLAEQLSRTIREISEELMDEETIACEVETDAIWLEAEGFPRAFSLRFILRTGRCAEGFWTATAVPGLLQALETIEVF